MMCGEWEEKLGLRAGGDLAASETAELEGHLAECAGCREAASQYGPGWAVLRQAHAESVTEADLASVRARVMEKLESRRRGAFWNWKWAWAGSVAAVATAVAFFAPVVNRGPVPVVGVGAAPPVVGQAIQPAAGFIAGAPLGRAAAAQKGCPTGNCGAPKQVVAQALSSDTPNAETNLGAAGVDARATAESEAQTKAEPLVVKLFTDDPNIVIYWIMESTGD